MRLSALQTGESGTVVKVLGHGGFRKRIMEMGFTRGTHVEVLLEAPLEDPVKYRLMGYEVSLRHEEAELIEVASPPTTSTTSPPPPLPWESGAYACPGSSGQACSLSCPYSKDTPPLSHGRGVGGEGTDAAGGDAVINVAIVGNPNCGKTSLFNHASGAHARVGNYSGVTVDATIAKAYYHGYTIRLIDLPGTYSLSAYSPEELYVRKYIVDETPDIVINVIDATNLERNLYLTTQLIDMNLRMVCALNMFDEFERRGDTVDLHTLGTLLGAPMVPTSFKTGRGVNRLFQMVVALYEMDGAPSRSLAAEVGARACRCSETKACTASCPWSEDDSPLSHGRGVVGEAAALSRHIHINHGQYIERAIGRVQAEVQQSQMLRHRFSTRFLAIKLLEGDADVERIVGRLPNAAQVLTVRDEAVAQVAADTEEDAETAIMDAKYGFIRGALAEANYATGTKVDTYRLTHRLDSLLSHRYLGFPIFFLMLFLVFETTFVLGQYPMDWIDAAVAWLGDTVAAVMPDGVLKDMVADGAIAGVGSVIVFLPQILILYFFISFMEDTGYMARAAFIMDRLMHGMGLHGKSFIPLIMGFGCNVPAILATRTIESRRSRLITMLVVPFMSCSARLPIYVMITGTFFAMRYRSLVMLSLYAVGIAVAVVASRMLSRHVVRGDDTPFVMELPPYRMPTSKAIMRHTWEKGKEYLRKMGGIILVASIVVWALGYFGPRGRAVDMENSFIGYVGQAIEPLFRPQGFCWKLDVSLLAGLGAKEIVASTIGVLYSEEPASLSAALHAAGVTPLAAYCYLLFVLLYFPCIATITAIRNESGSWRWALFAAVYTTAVAWIVSAAVYQIGLLAGG